MSKKEHWENVFSTKQEKEVSWYQQYPQTSIDLIKNLQVPLEAKIIDVGGGDSYLIDALLALGYTNLYLLDISSNAIDRIKNRLGAQASKVTFIVSNILDFVPTTSFDVWHDRASFHFLTEKNEIEKYKVIVSKAITQNGKLIIGTFSDIGPKKCSGLEISQYNEATITQLFESKFEKIACIFEDHQTPFDTTQNFIFCSFNKIKS
jgi:ubiquinone/menaquinone biosynthesis C-methylase UbiE